MEYLVICFFAFIVSGLTLFSGFGLGTLLMPLFALFFPVEIAVALTAAVHFLNNIFKFILLGQYADRQAVLRFGLPAIFTALIGASLLLRLSEMQPLISYSLAGREFQIVPVKLTIALLMVSFALFELAPRFEKLSFEKKYLPLGGIVSGFFGGLSGHQGAMRSAFLIKCGLTKEGFIATGVVIACIVDIARISIYAPHLLPKVSGNMPLVSAAAVSAFAGAFLGKKFIRKVTF